MTHSKTRGRMRSAAAFTLKYAVFIAVWVVLGYVITGGSNLERHCSHPLDSWTGRPLW